MHVNQNFTIRTIELMFPHSLCKAMESLAKKYTEDGVYHKVNYSGPASALLKGAPSGQIIRSVVIDEVHADTFLNECFLAEKLAFSTLKKTSGLPSQAEMDTDMPIGPYPTA